MEVGARGEGGARPRAAAHAGASRFTAIFDDTYDFVWRTVRRLGVAEGAVDDAAQEVFVVLARKLDEVEVGMEKSFLFGTARRVAAGIRRAGRARGEHVSDDALADAASELPDPEQALGTRRARATLHAILDRMDDDVREAFILFELEGLTKPEVAKILGVPEGTAASRLRRGREAFLAATERLKGKLSGGGA